MEWMDKGGQSKERKEMEKIKMERKGREKQLEALKRKERNGQEWKGKVGMERISRNGKEKKEKGRKGKKRKGIEWKERKGMEGTERNEKEQKGKGSRHGKDGRLPNGRRYMERKEGKNRVDTKEGEKEE
jgi:hypothetical protein